jgi:tetratricopeptide (TPR) repeat protein
MAQVKPADLYGSWVATDVRYLSGDELPDENILKYSYQKYSFAAPDKFYSSPVYHSLGREMLFSLSGDKVQLKSAEGHVMNVIRILGYDENKLVIVQASVHGHADPMAIKYTFHREEVLQNAMPLTSADIFLVHGTDTIYQSGQKVYALFKEPDFKEFLSFNLYKKGISVKSGELLASFIVNKEGVADSLKILQGINPRYDKVFTDLFNSVKRKWIPAQLNGKPVPVLMQQKMKYFTSDETMPSYFNGRKADEAYHNENYELALQYYNLALETRPEDKDHLYKRGVCKQKLGNLQGACIDWQKVKALGGEQATVLLERFCK